MVLDWSTAQEIDNDYFEVQRGTENGTFEVIDFIPGNGNSHEVNNYQFTDETPLFGSNFYRLRQVDYNGTFEFSNIVFTEVPDDGRLQIYPNPFRDVINIKLSNQEKVISAVVYDLSGKPVLQINDYNNEGNEAAIDFHKVTLPQGSYVLRLITNRRNVVKQMIRE